MDTKLVSIIIPVYNVGSYLSECIDSVCRQTYECLEIILVDDGSTDDSGRLIDIYAEKDKRIKNIHIANSGAAGARNYGLDICTGEYIQFLDSDDWIDTGMVEKLVTVIEERKADIVQCQFYDEFKHYSKKHVVYDKEMFFSGESFMNDSLTNWEDILLWNKLFRNSVLHGVRFVEGHRIDDEFFTYKTFINASRIAEIPDILYHYRMRKSGAMGNVEGKKQRLSDQIEFVTERYCTLRKHFPSIRSEVLLHLVSVLISVIQRSIEYPEINSRAKKKVTPIFS